MSIVYSLVARQQDVLCEFTEAGGNFPTITRLVLKQLAEEHSSSEGSSSSSPAQHRVFPYNAFNFFFLNDENLTFMCMADEKVRANVGFMMLDEVKTQFLARYRQQAQTVAPYKLSAFGPTLAGLMKKYDNLKIDTPLAQVRQKMEKVKMLMIENVNQLMDRGEKINMLVLRTETLQQESLKYEKETKKLKNVYWWKNMKYIVIIIVCLSLLAFIVTFFVCGIHVTTCGARLQNKATSAANKQIDKVGKFTNDTLNGWVDDTTSTVNSIHDNVKDTANANIDKLGQAADTGGVV